MQVFRVGSWISDGYNFSAFLDVGIDDEGTSFAAFCRNICDWSSEHVFVCNGVEYVSVAHLRNYNCSVGDTDLAHKNSR